MLLHNSLNVTLREGQFEILDGRKNVCLSCTNSNKLRLPGHKENLCMKITPVKRLLDNFDSR